MTEDKRLEDARKIFPQTKLSDDEKPLAEILFGVIDRLKEENEAYLIGGSMFAETGLSQSKKIKELEAENKEKEKEILQLVNLNTRIEGLCQHDIRKSEAKLKEADEGLVNSINRIDGMAKISAHNSGHDYNGQESKYARDILSSIRDKGESDD